MYQTFVLGLGALLIFGVAYFIQHTDQAGVVTSNLSTNKDTTQSATSTTSTSEPVSGTYVCDSDSKCENPRVLTLSENGELRMVTTFDNGVEVLEELGSWTFGQGMVTLIITGTPNELYAEPHTLHLKKMSSMTLVAAGGTTTYKDWGNPAFKKSYKEEE